jgi:hypothetical protein
MVVTLADESEQQICADFKDCDEWITKMNAKEARDLVNHMKDQAERDS